MKAHAKSVGPFFVLVVNKKIPRRCGRDLRRSFVFVGTVWIVYHFSFFCLLSFWILFFLVFLFCYLYLFLGPKAFPTHGVLLQVSPVQTLFHAALISWRARRWCKCSWLGLAGCDIGFICGGSRGELFEHGPSIGRVFSHTLDDCVLGGSAIGR